MSPIGVDEWVARSGERREYAPGWRGRVQRASERVGWWPRLALVGIAAFIYPHLGANSLQLQVGFNALDYAILALGLNIAVGWAGVLDLGYVAFFLSGAYGYALLSSHQLGPHGVHLAAFEAVPIVVVAVALLGLLVGLTSIRLGGDYLAIVTLFFGEASVEVVNNVSSSTFGGPNGITGIEPFHGLGGQIISTQGYFYIALIFTLVLMAALHLLNTSRTGRAWRAMREDPLAAQVMSIPVNSLRLMAFCFAAGVAGLAGTVFAAENIGVFPTDFAPQILILIYACLVLGGVGSIAGAVLGAVVVTAAENMLSSPTLSGYLFFGVILLALFVRLRPWQHLAAVIAATVGFGFAAHAIVGAISHASVAGTPGSTGWLGAALRNYVIVPTDASTFGNVLFVVMVVGIVAALQLHGVRRLTLIVPTIYVAACSFEARLIVDYAITAQVMVGAILIVIMIGRPHGLLGTKRVEVV